jgi:hypothetical protein
MENIEKQKIKSITDQLHVPCLYGGIHALEEDIQQYVCKCINGDNCGCYKKYKSYLQEKISN